MFEFEVFFYVSDARQRIAGTKTFCDEARHQPGYMGFLPTPNRSMNHAMVPLCFDLHHECVASKPHDAEQSGERLKRSDPPH